MTRTASDTAADIQNSYKLTACCPARTFEAFTQFRIGCRDAPFNQLIDEDPDSRESLVRESIRTLDAGFPVYVVVNNKAEGSAPLSVRKFAERFVEITTNSDKGA